MGVLRCLLALSVLLAHDVDGWFKLIDGAVAVQCFFLISGFYMALVLNERYAEAAASIATARSGCCRPTGRFCC